jgi:hypothetical protein
MMFVVAIPSFTLAWQKNIFEIQIKPWKVGQFIKYDEKFYENGRYIFTTSTTVSIVREHLINEKKYLWVELESKSNTSVARLTKILMPEQNQHTLEQFINGSNIDSIAPTRLIVQNDISVPGAISASPTEYDVDVNSIRDISRKYSLLLKFVYTNFKHYDQQKVKTSAGYFITTAYKGVFQNKLKFFDLPGLNGFKSARVEFWMSPKVPISGLVKEIIELEGPKQKSRITKVLELVSFGDVGAVEKVRNTPNRYSPEDFERLFGNVENK